MGSVYVTFLKILATGLREKITLEPGCLSIVIPRGHLNSVHCIEFICMNYF